MKKWCFFLFFYGFFCVAVAQSNFKEGYIVNLKGDTISGYINYKEWLQNPKVIDFKTGLSNKNFEKLTVNDIACFEIEHLESYQRFTIKSSQAPINLINASIGIDTTSKTDTDFLRLLSNGPKVALYSFSDKIKTRFYYKEKNMAVPEELIYSIFFQNENMRALVTKLIFRNQLVEVATNAQRGDLVQAIQRLNYDRNDLIDIVEKINGIDKQQAATQRSHNSVLRFYAGGGVSVTTLEYTGNSPFYNPAPAVSTFPKLNFGFEAYLNPNIGRAVINTALGFTMNNFNVSGTNRAGILGGAATQKVQQAVVSLDFDFLYNFFNANDLKIFLSAGMSLNYFNTVSNIFTTTAIPTTYTLPNFPEMVSFVPTFPFRTGVTIKRRIEVSATYFPSFANITDNYVDFGGKYRGFEIGLNYFLSKNKKSQLP